VSRARVRKPVLGRMSVFVIGILLGVVAGAIGALFGGPVFDQIDPGAFLSTPVFASVTAPARPAPSVVQTAAVQAAPAPPPPQVLHVSASRPVVIGVFGDSLGDGLWAGLYHQLRDGKSYEVVRFSRAATGLARYDYVNVQERAAAQLADRHIDIAVVMVGANDEQGIIENHQVYGFDSPRWREVYASRIDNLVGLLRRNGVAVYWVGLPKMRRSGFDQKAQILNSLYSSRAAALGVPFIPTVPVTIDGNGGYDDYLSVGGRPQLMRAKDGVHMTMAGYLRIAAPVSGLIRTDVGRALQGGKPPTHAEADPPAGEDGQASEQ
jgi:hypothetical protein